jgi:predicted anti-sigma-YlaC factor YlaD
MGLLMGMAMAEATGGAVAGIVADSILYGIDSVKVRQQSEAIQTGSAGGIRILFRAMAPSILLGNVPVFGTFFLVYAPLREMIQQHHSEYQSFLLLASAVCAIPATLVGIPSDVIKKRLALGIDPHVNGSHPARDQL